MDSSPGDWTASALFSPSKARAQQAQAKDWAYVEAWLVRKYGKRLPTVERNEDTLQALLALATLNEVADEQRLLVEKVEKTALQASAKRNQGDDDGAYETLLGDLHSNGEEALDALARIAVALGTKGTLQAAKELSNLTAEHFELNEQVRRVDMQHASLVREQARLLEVLRDLKRDSFRTPGKTMEQTAEWGRNTKHLKAKVTEYEERLGALRINPSPSLSAEDVLKQLEDVEGYRRRLNERSRDLSTFNSLPSDPQAAKAKLENARAQLRSATTRRDELFEELVGGH